MSWPGWRLEPHVRDQVEAWTRLARSASARAEQRRFLVEGLRAVEMLAERGDYPIDEVLLDVAALRQRKRDARPRIDALVARLGGTLIGVDRDAYRQVAGTAKPRGILAVARMPDVDVTTQLAALADSGGLAIAASGLADAGNLGTLIRSGAAFGASLVLALEGTVDPFHPKVLRASAGHLLPAARTDWATLRASGVHLLGLDLDSAATPLDALQPRGATVVVVGSEGHGLPSELRFDETVQIPMAAGVESLNAGVAGSLVLWRLRRG